MSAEKQASTVAQSATVEQYSTGQSVTQPEFIQQQLQHVVVRQNQQPQQFVVGQGGVIQPVQPLQPIQPVQLQPVPPTVYTVVPSHHPAFVEEGALDSPEASVSKPLSIVSLFCFFQLWFSIPAIVLAYTRSSTRQHHKTSIALSITAIVLGMCGALVMMSFGLVMPYIHCYYTYNDYYECHSH